MAELTKDIDLVTQALVDLFETNAPTLGLQAVYYGDQNRIGATPCLAIEAGNKEQELGGTGYYAKVTFNVAIMVYFAKIINESDLKREATRFAQEIEDVIHAEPAKNLNGLIIHGHVHRNEPGTAVRAGAKMRAHRLMWRGISRAHL